MDSKVTSILSYFGVLWLVAYFAGTKDDKSLYHLKQGFGLFVIEIIFLILIEILSLISGEAANVISYVGIVFLVLTIIGIINALKSGQKPLPIIGKSFDGFDFIK